MAARASEFVLVLVLVLALVSGTTGCQWRQTAGCDPRGPREADSDRLCNDVVPKGMSGFCECVDVDGVAHRASEVTCDHPPLACSVECRALLGERERPPREDTAAAAAPTTAATVTATGAAAPTASSTDRPAQSYRCVGWHQTAGCDAAGARDVGNDRGCSEVVAPGASGYCQCKGEADGAYVVLLAKEDADLNFSVTVLQST